MNGGNEFRCRLRPLECYGHRKGLLRREVCVQIRTGLAIGGRQRFDDDKFVEVEFHRLSLHRNGTRVDETTPVTLPRYLVSVRQASSAGLTRTCDDVPCYRLDAPRAQVYRPR